MTKAPTPTEMSKGQSDNTNNATKSSIKQRLRTDLGRSVGVTKATQLVWLTGNFTYKDWVVQCECDRSRVVHYMVHWSHFAINYSPSHHFRPAMPDMRHRRLQSDFASFVHNEMCLFLRVGRHQVILVFHWFWDINSHGKHVDFGRVHGLMEDFVWWRLSGYFLEGLRPPHQSLRIHDYKFH